METRGHIHTGHHHMTLGVVIHLILVRLSRPSIPFNPTTKHLHDGRHSSILAMDL